MHLRRGRSQLIITFVDKADHQAMVKDVAKKGEPFSEEIPNLSRAFSIEVVERTPPFAPYNLHYYSAAAPLSNECGGAGGLRRSIKWFNKC